MTRRPDLMPDVPAATAGKWGDLTRRLASALVLLFIAAMLLLSHGIWLRLFTAVVIGVMFWELARMTGWRYPDMHRTPFGTSRPVVLALLAGLGLFVALIAMRWGAGWLALGLPIVAGLPGASGRDRMSFALFGAAIMAAGYHLVVLREAAGAVFLLWVMGVVIASDTLGYFAGRLIGGPKFWPKISPNKTWSGTVAGWIGAMVWGAGLGLATGHDVLTLALMGLPISLAGQLGDIAESWLKRRAGVKDSSNLIPGHGGLMDRFDALCGAILTVSVLFWLGWPGQGGW